MSLVRETVEKNSSGWPTQQCQGASWHHGLPGSTTTGAEVAAPPAAELARPPSKGQFCSQAEVMFPFCAWQRWWQPFHGLQALWMPWQMGQVCRELPGRLQVASLAQPFLLPGHACVTAIPKETFSAVTLLKAASSSGRQ